LKTLNQRIGDLGPARWKRVEARVATLIAEELTPQGTPPSPQADSAADGENARHQSAIDCGVEEQTRFVRERAPGRGLPRNRR
jgi:hypothetical protein